MELTNTELMDINGGGITAAFLQGITKAVSTVYDIGRAFGSAIRRITSGNICQI